MYVVVTMAELTQYAGFWRGFDGLEDSGIEENLGLDPRDLEEENSGLSPEEMDAFEVCLTEWQARRMGILAPRGEYWISRSYEGQPSNVDVPKARAPSGRMSEFGKGCQLKLVPDRDQQTTECDP